MKIDKTLFWNTLLGITIIEICSLAAYHFHSPTLQIIGWGAVFLGTLVLSLWNIEYGVLIAFTELFIGSFGHLFQLPLGDSPIAIRIGIFFAIQIAYNTILITHFLRQWTGHPFFVRLHRFFQKGLHDSVILTSFFRGPYFYPNVVLTVALVLAALVGFTKHNAMTNIFHDADAYVVFAYFPIVWAALRSQKSRERIATIFTASLVWFLAQTALVLFIFSHRLREPMQALYVWIRDARIGEITIIAGDFYRIFFQSYIYALIAVFIFASMIIFREKEPPTRRGALYFLAISLFLLLVSFSRSFWFGGAIATLALGGTLFFFKKSTRIWRGLLRCGGGFLIAIGLLFGIVNFPIPYKGPPILLADLFAGRASALFGEAAAGSRWHLLPIMWNEIKKSPVLGSGFGHTLTYITDDPRYRAEDASGARTTYAFEWGYLDLWLKLGVVGLLAYGWLIARILRHGWMTVIKCQVSDVRCQVSYGLWLGMIALLAAHFFTPYLNHPLGIGALILAAAWFESPEIEV